MADLRLKQDGMRVLALSTRVWGPRATQVGNEHSEVHTDESRALYVQLFDGHDSRDADCEIPFVELLIINGEGGEGSEIK